MSKPPDDPAAHLDDTVALVRRALHGLRFGEIVIAVHDGEVVQIARTEKLRPPRSRG